MQNSTALLDLNSQCPCQSGELYSNCCQPLHLFETFSHSAEQLMRSRYSAYVLQKIDYIIKTTVPAQQTLLNVEAMMQWAKETRWCSLSIKQHKNLSKIHSAVEFEAFFETAEGMQSHHEHSVFVQIAQRWFFVDPTVELPTMKQPCLCGSGRKFKHCCGAYL